MRTLLAKVIDQKVPCVFISPHLDDAILSCGNLITVLRGKTDTKVVTLFTEAGKGPETLSARMFLQQCGVSDAHELFAIRRQEDKEVLTEVGATWEHLGFPDALWRKRSGGSIRGFFGRLIPEIVHTYPTYRFHITSGRIAPAEGEFIENVLETLKKATVQFGHNALYFFPLGLGKHVDHVLTHTVGLRFLSKVVFYADFPYCLSDAPDEAAITQQGYTKVSFEGGNTKHELIRRYQTQPLFPGEIPSVPEVYFFPH